MLFILKFKIYRYILYFTIHKDFMQPKPNVNLIRLDFKATFSDRILTGGPQTLLSGRVDLRRDCWGRHP